MKLPTVSIIIPTYFKSKDVLEIPLKSVADQKCPEELYEVIIADNKGGESIKKLSIEYGARMVNVYGSPPQSCRQVNLGAKSAKGEYLMLLDHDVELSPFLIGNFVESLKEKKNKEIDAWIIPYKIVANGKLLTAVRNFEELFYKNSVIATARIIKKSVFFKTESQYDVALTNGPADWDLTIQLISMDKKFDYIKDHVYHHEEDMNLWQFILKKTIYAKGGERYQKKWHKKNRKVYNNIVKKQYDPKYRLFGIFIENGKWKMLIPNLHFYFLFLALKVTTAAIYLFNLQKAKL